MTDGGGLVLIAEKMFDTVAAATKCFTCAMVFFPVTDNMVEEGEGMTSVGNG